MGSEVILLISLYSVTSVNLYHAKNLSQFYIRILNKNNQIIYQNKPINNIKKENNPVHDTG
jgi:hypothetical protein